MMLICAKARLMLSNDMSREYVLGVLISALSQIQTRSKQNMSSDYMIDSIHKILNPYGPINEATTTVLCDIEVIWIDLTSRK